MNLRIFSRIDTPVRREGAEQYLLYSLPPRPAKFSFSPPALAEQPERLRRGQAPV